MGSRLDLSGFSGRYRSGRTRARVAAGLLAAIGAVSLVTAIHFGTGFGIIDQAEAGLLTTPEADAYDATTQLLAQIWLVLYVATGIAFFTWVSRAVDNVPMLTGERPLTTPRWSIGWWFVPFANLVMPYRVTNDLAKRMAPPGVATWVVLVWWLAWIATNVVALASYAVAAPENLDELAAFFTVNAAAEVVTVAAAALAIVVVLRTQAHADAKAALAGLSESGAAVPPAARPTPPCPRCGVPRKAGERYCPSCGLDLWADFDKRAGGEAEG